MYLKKLALAGFKSFAEPVELEFSKGVSAIVGPNGSGKSNITDAIRWVLGEQSTKSLRGKKMEDVIFSGTEKKKPLNYAEVTLTLDNTSGFTLDNLDEIVITRRLFRSGESEYRMNQKNCKLKDIHELFMDTGLGKNGYSLISQGGIENIIGASPQELRGIVEEAVGIVNYKTKKQEAEKKLENTQNNLERLKDILEEIEKQLKPLKAQSEKAKEYLELREALKKVDLMVFYHNMKDASEQLAAYEKQLAEVRFQIFEIEKKTGEKDRAFQNARGNIRGITEQADAMAEALEQLKKRIGECERELLITQGKSENESANAERLTQDLNAHLDEHGRFQAEYDALTASRDAAAQAYEAENADLQKLVDEKSRHQAELEAEKLKQAEGVSLREEREQQRAVLNDTLLDLKTRLAGFTTKKSFHEDQLKRVSAEQERSSQLLSDTLLEAEQNERTRARLAAETESLRNQTEEAEKKAQGLKNDYSVLENNYKVNLSQRDYLKSVQKNYSDYFPSIRTIMNSREHLGDMIDKVYGPVGELLSIPDRFTMAVDVALGAKSQNIVVEDVTTANQCINILKKQRAGRATFLPLDNLRYGRVEARDLEILSRSPGFEGIASELVEYGPRFKRVIESLLGRIVVAADFNAGRAIQKALFGKYTVVTLEGEIFYPGGAIVGGDTKSGKQSPLFKKAEIEKLEAEMKRQDSEKLKIKAAYREAFKAYEALKEAAKKAELRLNSVEQEHWKISQNLETTKKRMAESDRIFKSLQDDAGSSLENEKRLRETVAQKEAELAALEAEMEQDDTGSAEYIEVVRGAIEGLNRKISEGRIKLARDNEGIRSLEQQMAMIHSQIETCISREKKVESEIRACRESSALHRTRCEVLKVETEELQAAVDEKRAALESFSTETREQTAISEALEQEIKDLNHQLILQNETKNNAEMAKNKLEMQMTHWEENIFESYDMNFVMVGDIYEALSQEDLDLSPENQRSLKGRMAAMGNVNVGAIEEYLELNERYGFMSAQYKDLTKAKGELERIIDSLYESMERQFAKQFAELQKKFTRIFGILFEGGKAHIEYTDPENVLESGIELVAQPPGKNLRHISLLSGGEKSMIAIALLFSFLELNPSPFCVIDEIDAALDDHNIYRFTSYLEHIATDNQFIIITHRKSTLEACDAIYGVSMAKNGISKLVAVRLSDYIEPGA